MGVQYCRSMITSGLNVWISPFDGRYLSLYSRIGVRGFLSFGCMGLGVRGRTMGRIAGSCVRAVRLGDHRFGRPERRLRVCVGVERWDLRTMEVERAGKGGGERRVGVSTGGEVVECVWAQCGIV